MDCQLQLGFDFLVILSALICSLSTQFEVFQNFLIFKEGRVCIWAIGVF